MAEVTVINVGDPNVAVTADHNLMKKASARPMINAAPTGVTTVVEVDVEVPRTVRYNMRGYYPVSGQFEYWQTTDPEADPPSGNPLIDKTQVSTFT